MKIVYLFLLSILLICCNSNSGNTPAKNGLLSEDIGFLLPEEVFASIITPSQRGLPELEFVKTSPILNYKVNQFCHYSDRYINDVVLPNSAKEALENSDFVADFTKLQEMWIPINGEHRKIYWFRLRNNN